MNLQRFVLCEYDGEGPLLLRDPEPLRSNPGHSLRRCVVVENAFRGVGSIDPGKATYINTTDVEITWTGADFAEAQDRYIVALAVYRMGLKP